MTKYGEKKRVKIKQLFSSRSSTEKNKLLVYNLL